jgi:hypothetical protein
MKAWTSQLAAAKPPLWLSVVIAAVVAAALLCAFVDTLRENLRRGDQLRQAQAPAVRQPALAAMAGVTTARTGQPRLH